MKESAASCIHCTLTKTVVIRATPPRLCCSPFIPYHHYDMTSFSKDQSKLFVWDHVTRVYVEALR